MINDNKFHRADETHSLWRQIQKVLPDVPHFTSQPHYGYGQPILISSNL